MEQGISKTFWALLGESNSGDKIPLIFYKASPALLPNIPCVDVIQQKTLFNKDPRVQLVFLSTPHHVQYMYVAQM
jgi:hypothetical protein